MPLIRVSEEVRSKLIKLQGRLQAIKGRRISINDVIEYLLEREERLTPDDIELVKSFKGSDSRRYTSLLATAYAVKESKPWSKVMAELRSECGADVDSASDEQLECIIRYLEPKVGLSSETPTS